MIEEIKAKLKPEDFEAWQWAVMTCQDERCLCHREVPYRDSQGKEQWVDELEASYRAQGLELPTMYVAWNPKCPIHGFPVGSAEYQKTPIDAETAEMEQKWYQHWRDLMESEEVVR